MDAMTYQAAVAAVTPVVIERLKRFMPEKSIATLSRWASGVMAIASAAGFQIGASGAAPCLVLPEGGAFVDFGVRAVLQYAIQEVVYRTAIARKPEDSGTVRGTAA